MLTKMFLVLTLFLFFFAIDRGFAFSQQAGNDHLVTDQLNKNLK